MANTTKTYSSIEVALLELSTEQQTRINALYRQIDEINREYDHRRMVLVLQNKNFQPEEVFDAKAAAGFLGVSESHVRALTSRGEMPYSKVGGCARYLRSELEAYLKGEWKSSMERTAVQMANEYLWRKNHGKQRK